MRNVIANSEIKVLIVVIVLFLALYPGKFVEGRIVASEEDQVKNVIIISWDGVQKGHLQELLDQNKLPNLQALITEGGNTVVGIAPFIKVINGTPIIRSYSEIKPEDEIYFEQAVTDSGHARMLTGRWNHLTGIYDIYENASAELIDYICGNNLYTVRDGLTIMEVLKKKMLEFKVGVASGRHSDLRKCKDQYENLISIFRGWGNDTIYMLVASEGVRAVGDHGFFSTTFSNATPDLDFFFDSDYYLANMPSYPYDYGYLPIWNYTGNLVFLGELKDDVVAMEAMNWVRSVKEDRFFLFIHFCEPDLFGHIYGENSGNYSEAIISNDQALGTIINELKQLGIYNETLTIVTTDHGATENAPGATFYIDDQGRKWVTSLGPLHGQLDENNHVIWMVNNKFSYLPYNVTYQTDIVPFILQALGFSSHDIGIIDVSSSKTVVGQGYSLHVSAQLLNYGVNTERFNLTVYANETVVQSIEIALSRWNSSIITFTWNTTGFAKGHYTISAYADPVPSEIDTTDNIFVDGIVEVTEIAISVGGTWIPVNKLELLAPYIGLTTLLAVAVVTLGYVKKRKRNTEINS